MNTDVSIMSAIDLLKRLEGFRGSAYFDVKGYAIGFGNHYYENGTPVGPGDKITYSRAVALLEFYTALNAAAIVSKITGPVTTGLLTSLISLRYNCGSVPASLLSLINSGADLETIKQKFLSTCTTSGGVYSSDLVARRLKEWEAGLSLAGKSLLFTGAVLFGLFLAFKTIFRK